MITDKSSFDGIANKFDENIYGTSKGRLRHQLLLYVLKRFLDGASLKVLDAGGGTGMMSREFAKRGHHVTLCDISSDVLSIARDRLSDYTNVTILQSSIDELHENNYDLILCHSVLEWMPEPIHAIDKMMSCLNPAGHLSLSFFNRYAKLFNNMVYGNFDYVEQGMPSKNTVRLNPHNAQEPKTIIKYMSQRGDCDIVSTRGLICIHDYMNDPQKQRDLYTQLVEMEIKYGSQEPYKWLGKYFHMLIKARI